MTDTFTNFDYFCTFTMNNTASMILYFFALFWAVVYVGCNVWWWIEHFMEGDMGKQNIRMPLRNCYQLGIDAFNGGLSQNANPYDTRTEMDRHRWWRDGYLQAQEAKARKRHNARYDADEKED